MTGPNVGTFVKVEVTPVAATGITNGIIILSASTSIVLSDHIHVDANDASVDLAIGNKSIDSSNNSWTIAVNSGTLKTNLNNTDLTYPDLPSGLILTAVKGLGNTIVITVSGSCTNAIMITRNVNISIKPSAVSEEVVANSNEITVQLNPSMLVPTDGFTILNGTAIASSNNNLTATATITLNQGNPGTEYIIFELFNGTTPMESKATPFNYESNPTAAKAFVANFDISNNLTSNYSVKIHVLNSDSIAGVDLATIKTIPLILFSQLNFDDNSQIGIEDIIKFMSANSGSTDLNHDGNIDNEDIRSLLNQISLISEF